MDRKPSYEYAPKLDKVSNTSAILDNYLTATQGRGVVPDGDNRPCLVKTFQIQANFRSGSNTLIIYKPLSARTRVGDVWIYDDELRQWIFTQALQLPVDLTEFAAARTASSLVCVWSAAQSTTYAPLEGRITAVSMYDLPTDTPDFDKLSAMTPLQQSKTVNAPLYDGVVVKSSPKFDNPYEIKVKTAWPYDTRYSGAPCMTNLGQIGTNRTLIERLERSPYNCGAMRVEGTFRVTAPAAGNPAPQTTFNILMNFTDSVGNAQRVERDFVVPAGAVVGTGVEFSMTGYPLSQDYILTSVVYGPTTDNTVGDIFATVTNCDSVYARDGHQVGVVVVQGLQDPRNLVVSGEWNLQLVPYTRNAPQVSLLVTPECSLSVIEAYKIYFAHYDITNVRETYTRTGFAHFLEDEFPVLRAMSTVRDVAALEDSAGIGFASRFTDKWKKTVSALKAQGVKPGRILQQVYDTLASRYMPVARPFLDPIVGTTLTTLENHGYAARGHASGAITFLPEDVDYIPANQVQCTVGYASGATSCTVPAVASAVQAPQPALTPVPTNPAISRVLGLVGYASSSNSWGLDDVDVTIEEVEASPPPPAPTTPSDGIDYALLWTNPPTFFARRPNDVFAAGMPFCVVKEGNDVEKAEWVKAVRMDKREAAKVVGLYYLVVTPVGCNSGDYTYVNKMSGDKRKQRGCYVDSRLLDLDVPASTLLWDAVSTFPEMSVYMDAYKNYEFQPYFTVVHVYGLRFEKIAGTSYYGALRAILGSKPCEDSLTLYMAAAEVLKYGEGMYLVTPTSAGDLELKASCYGQWITELSVAEKAGYLIAPNCLKVFVDSHMMIEAETALEGSRDAWASVGITTVGQLLAGKLMKVNKAGAGAATPSMSTDVAVSAFTSARPTMILCSTLAFKPNPRYTGISNKADVKQFSSTLESIKAKLLDAVFTMFPNVRTFGSAKDNAKSYVQGLVSVLDSPNKRKEEAALQEFLKYAEVPPATAQLEDKRSFFAGVIEAINAPSKMRTLDGYLDSLSRTGDSRNKRKGKKGGKTMNYEGSESYVTRARAPVDKTGREALQERFLALRPKLVPASDIMEEEDE